MTKQQGTMIKKLVALLQRCRDKGVKLNRENLQLRLKEVAYMGHVLTAEGLQPDPEKVKAIKEMPTPTDKQSIPLRDDELPTEVSPLTFRDHDSPT